MEEFVTRLKKETERKIRVIETVEADIIKRALSISKMLEETLSELKDFIEGYTFADDAQEIEFFKEKKPEFFRLLLFYRKVYHIETNRPLGSIETQVAYLKDELNRIQSYIEKRLVFYRYYRSGASYLDRDFFLRANAHLSRREQYNDSFYFERDPVFSTSFDFTVAKIMSHDLLQAYLLSELAVLEGNPQQPGRLLPAVRLTWTGTKTELIELVYALDTMGCFSYGKVPLIKIASYFESVFNIDLGGNIARNFYDMRIRSEPTSFLDHLREKLLRRIVNTEGGHKKNKKK